MLNEASMTDKGFRLRGSSKDKSKEAKGNNNQLNILTI